jgi:hypothetical protein
LPYGGEALIPRGFQEFLFKSVCGSKDLQYAEQTVLLERAMAGRIRTLDLPLERLFERMENREIQDILIGLFREKRIEQTMLAGFLQGHPELRDLFLSNLSRNVRMDVEEAGPFTSLWAGQADLLFRNILSLQWRHGLIDSPSFSGLSGFLADLEMALLADRLGDESFSAFLLSPDSAEYLPCLIRDLPSIILARAVTGLGEGVRALLMNGMESEKKRTIFREDLGAVLEGGPGEMNRCRKLVQEEMVRLMVIGELSGYTPAKVLSGFQEGLEGIEKPALGMLVNEIGIVRFSKALTGVDPGVRRRLFEKSGALLAALLKDILSGKIRYKSVVSSKEAEEVRFEVLQTLCIWKKTGLA